MRASRTNAVGRSAATAGAVGPMALIGSLMDGRKHNAILIGHIAEMAPHRQAIDVRGWQTTGGWGTYDQSFYDSCQLQFRSSSSPPDSSKSGARHPVQSQRERHAAAVVEVARAGYAAVTFGDQAYHVQAQAKVRRFAVGGLVAQADQ